MIFNSGLTFRYQFSVRASGVQQGHWVGDGEGRADFDQTESLAGPKPRFELSSGWLTLFPTEGWTRSFPARSFSDSRRAVREMDEDGRIADARRFGEQYGEAQKEAHKEVAAKSLPRDDNSYRKAQEEATERALRAHGLTRDLVSYSLFVGEALGSVLRDGDQLNFSLGAGVGFHYALVRDSEAIFSAGSPDGGESGWPIAVWQEYDRHPNPRAKDPPMIPGLPVAQEFEVCKPYVTARLYQQVFHLLDGEEAEVAPYYVFLARSNQAAPGLAFGVATRVVYSAGRLDTLRKELIIDAAIQLTKPQIILL